jgi:hypothetical protein
MRGRRKMKGQRKTRSRKKSKKRSRSKKSGTSQIFLKPAVIDVRQGSGVSGHQTSGDQT